jgi:3-dehydroquinate dehydratase-2
MLYREGRQARPAIGRTTNATAGHLAAIYGKLAVMKKQKPASGASAEAPESAPKARVLVLHGPNLNLLGLREPQHYGRRTLAEINRALAVRAEAAGVELEAFQSNHEGALIERVHAAREQGVAFIVINPAGYTHTSVALRDALAGVDIPFVEVHLSNVFAREAFRHHSYLSDLAVGVISGLGSEGYLLALEFALNRLAND